MRRYPRINPESLRGGSDRLPYLCFVLHRMGFFLPRNCSASGELLPRLFTLTCASLPKNRRCLFCDTFRHRALANAAPACFTRHAAVWCSDFPLANLASHQRSSAISAESIMKSEIWKPGLPISDCGLWKPERRDSQFEIQDSFWPMVRFNASTLHPSIALTM